MNRFFVARTDNGVVIVGKDPAMPFYVNDWLSSPRVMVMSLEQQGAYLRLLCVCWASQDASIPGDDATLSRLSGLNEGWFKGGCEMVGRCFEPHPTKTGFLTNLKLFELWQERQEWRRKSVIGGRKSAACRRLFHLKGGCQMVATKGQPKGNSSSSSLEEEARVFLDSDSVGSSQESAANPSEREAIVEKAEASFALIVGNSQNDQQARARDRKKKTPQKLETMTDAEKIYSLYPRKVKRADALKAIVKALMVEDFEVLVDAVIAFSDSTVGRGKFCPYPATWFNAEQWKDDRNEWNDARESGNRTPEQQRDKSNGEAIASFMRNPRFRSGDSVPLRIKGNGEIH